MATTDFEELVEDFEFLEDWEDRYRHVIDQGKAMDALAPELCVPATKVEGCASQVWLHAEMRDGKLHFDGASDAMIVSGLIAVLRTLYNGLTPVGAGGGRAGRNGSAGAQRALVRATLQRPDRDDRAGAGDGGARRVGKRGSALSTDLPEHLWGQSVAREVFRSP